MLTPSNTGRRQGVLADWDDKRGFGFIRPAAGGPRVFVHVSAFPRSHRPVAGCDVTFAESRDGRGKTQAERVHYLTPPSRSRPRVMGLRSSLAVAVTFFAVLAGFALTDDAPFSLVAASFVLSILTFLAYGRDKRAATRDEWRTPESTLHLLALAGGWPGALLAQRYFRHKTKKQPFRTIFWFTVVVNVGAVAWFVYEAPVPLP